MSTETIALLTILRDETQSRAVHARCVAEIERLGKPPAPRAIPIIWKAAHSLGHAAAPKANCAVAIDWAAINHPKANMLADVQIVRIK